MKKRTAEWKAKETAALLGEGWQWFVDERNDGEDWSFHVEKGAVRVIPIGFYHRGGELGELAREVHLGFFFALLGHPEGKDWPSIGTRTTRATQSEDPREAVRLAIEAEREAQTYYQECIEAAESIAAEWRE